MATSFFVCSENLSGIPPGVIFYSNLGNGRLIDDETRITTEVGAQIRWPFTQDAEASNLSVNVLTNTLSTASCFVRSRIDNTTLNEVEIPAGETGVFTNSEAPPLLVIEEGSLINYQIETEAGGTGSIRILSIGNTLYPTTDSTISLYSMFLDFDSTSSTRYIGLGGGIVGTDGAVEASNQHRIFAKGRYKNLACNVITNSKNADHTIRIRKNGNNGNSLITIPATTTGVFEDITNTDYFKEGDLLSISMSGGTGALTAVISVFFESQNDAFDLFCSTNQAGSTVRTTFGESDSWCVNGNFESYPDGHLVELAFPSAGDSRLFRNARVYIKENTLDAAATYSFLNSGVPTGLAVTVGAGQTGWFENTKDSAIVEYNPALDTISIGCTAGGTVGDILVFSFGLTIGRKEPRLTITV